MVSDGETDVIPQEWEKAAKDLACYLSSLCAPPSNEPTEAWAEKHVKVQDGPFAGSNWRAQFTPFARFIFAAMRDPSVRRVVLMFSAQYIKTLALIIDFLRNAKEDPADCMWVMAEADNIAEFVDKRLMPYIEECAPVAPLVLRKAKGIVQLEGMNLMLRGSSSTAKLRSDPVRRIYCDERADWRKGAIDKLRKRTRTFPNSMEISAGTAGDENDELHTDYLEGSQTRAHFLCPHCGRSQPIRFGRDENALWKQPRECGGFVWETSEKTKSGGVWNYEAVGATVRYECENPSCRALFPNADKYSLLRTIHPHDYNPAAPAWCKSFGGSAFEAIWESCDWDKLVVEFLKAKEQAKLGNVEALKTYVQETLGEPWQDRLGVVEDFGFLEARKDAYEYGEVWPEERRRFMAADKGEAGGEHYWWVVRAFGANGKSRLVAHGKASTKAELEDIRKQHKVSPVDAMIDSGYRAQDVYRFCAGSGWKALKGDDGEYYLESYPHPQLPGKTIVVRQLWRKTQAVVYNAQTKAKIGNLPLFTFCGSPTKDLLMEYMTGLVGEWTIPATVAKLYMRHMTGEHREQKTDAKGAISSFWKRIDDQHFFDCEQMILIAAIISKALNAPALKTHQTAPTL